MKLTYLPQSWMMVSLDEVAEVITGSTPPTSHLEYYGGTIPFIKPPHLVGKPITSTEDTISSTGAAYARIVPVNAVLVSCIGNLGKTGLTARESAFNQQINAVVFGRAVEPRFGFYACQLLVPYLESVASATTIPIVNKTKFSKALIVYCHNIVNIFDGVE